MNLLKGYEAFPKNIVLICKTETGNRDSFHMTRWDYFVLLSCNTKLFVGYKE